MARSKSGLESIAQILILIDGILKLVGGILALLRYLEAGIGFNVPDVPGNSGVGGAYFELTFLVAIIITIVIGVIYIMHFTGRVDMDSAMMNGIVFLILSLIFGGILTLIGSILYIIAGLT